MIDWHALKTIFKTSVQSVFVAELILAVLILTALPSLLNALPFNDDMVDSQLKPGQVMRALPQNSVPLGSSNDFFQSKEEALTAENNVKPSVFSIANGRRLYRVNCYPCHGKMSKDDYQPGPVTRFMPGPNLAADLYHSKQAGGQVGVGRTDADIFATIRFGNVIMPAIGWKLSQGEIWDVVNFVRHVQNN